MKEGRERNLCLWRDITKKNKTFLSRRVCPCLEEKQKGMREKVGRRKGANGVCVWGNFPPLAFGEGGNSSLAAFSHVATWMEILCASSRTPLTRRFIMCISAARGPPQQERRREPIPEEEQPSVCLTSTEYASRTRDLQPTCSAKCWRRTGILPLSDRSRGRFQGLNRKRGSWQI